MQIIKGWDSALLLGPRPSGMDHNLEALPCLSYAVTTETTPLNSSNIPQSMAVWKQMDCCSSPSSGSQKINFTHLLIGKSLIEVRLDSYLSLGCLDILFPTRTWD